MSASDPPIIQGDHPFKVEAVLSKTGGINALAKRPTTRAQGEALSPDHHERLPGESISDSPRVRLDANQPRSAADNGPTFQDQYDTRHREHFDDPSRQLRTDQRIKIPSNPQSMRLGDVQEQADATGPDHNAGHQVADAATSAALPDQRSRAGIASTSQKPGQRQQMLKRIEQIKSSNESVEKNLEALEKKTPGQAPLKPLD